MTYDTALPSARLYGGFVRRQTETALDAVAPHVDLLIGLPAYHTSNIGHHDDAETGCGAAGSATSRSATNRSGSASVSRSLSTRKAAVQSFRDRGRRRRFMTRAPFG